MGFSVSSIYLYSIPIEWGSVGADNAGAPLSSLASGAFGLSTVVLLFPSRETLKRTSGFKMTSLIRIRRVFL